MQILELFLKIHWLIHPYKKPQNNMGEYRIYKTNISIYPLKVKQKNQNIYYHLFA